MRWHNKRNGFTLAEILIAVIIITILVIAGFEGYVRLARLLQEEETRFTALTLASSQIEELKELGLVELQLLHPTGGGPFPPTGAALQAEVPHGFDLTYHIEYGNWPEGYPYGIIISTCDYPGTAQNQVRLIGYVVR